MGRNVLELGCGLGTVGIACARFGAQSVHLTDYDEDMLLTCTQSAALNDVSDRVSTSRLDWNDLVGSSRQPLGDLAKYDLVLGADIIYEESHAKLVLEVIARLLCDGGAK